MADHDPRPLIAITTGDPAGIGPEVVLKALAHPSVYAQCRPLVVGDGRALQRALSWLPDLDLTFHVVSQPAEGVYVAGTVDILDLHDVDPDECPVGEVSAAGGRAAVDAVFRACDLALSGAVDAMATAPLNKAAMNLAGFHYAGHTELLTERTGATRVSMLLDRRRPTGRARQHPRFAGRGDSSRHAGTGRGGDRHCRRSPVSRSASTRRGSPSPDSTPRRRGRAVRRRGGARHPSGDRGGAATRA